MLDLVIFDADGVLFESGDSNTAYYNAIFKALGEPPLSPEEERLGVFLSAKQVFEHRAGADLERIRRMHEVGAQIDFTPFFHLLNPPFELRPFLLDIKTRHKIGLATNRSVTVPRLLDHLNLAGVFDAIACTSDNVRPKPAPDIVNLCIERAGVRKDAAIYVGDSEIDYIAAQTAGVKFIGLGDRVQSPTVIERLHDLPAALERVAAL
ncbi:MAG TPA: HAD family hydrolase [Candidatus Binataceae bacterium]|jgi:phosphoglycolate phosphatase-like HAD superfamily hydrolase|nr:HAD family hydrolase [Candidatus Binataceae bacterium]